MVLLNAEPSPADAPRALLGRDQELAILRAFFTGAATDGGSLVVSGELGVGKSAPC